MILSDLHVHTSRDHGHHSAAEMAAQAAQQGLQTLGLVGHADTDFSCHYAMTPENEAAFLAETEALRQQYAGKLDLYRGIELDYYSSPTDAPYDYRIGSVHYVKYDDRVISVDSDPKELIAAAQHLFGGDWAALCRMYYTNVADLGRKFAPQIIGHFDLITKFNEDGQMFSMEDPVYRKAALDAVDVLLEKDRFFEINSGAISRGCRITPYPAPFMLKEIHDRGGRIMLSSDAHAVNTMLFQFEQSMELARAVGFKTVWVLTPEGFREQPI